MYVCIQAIEVIISTRLGKQVGLENSKVEFEDGLCRSHRDSYAHHQRNYFSEIFEPQV